MTREAIPKVRGAGIHHASAVAFEGQGVVIFGASGSGKSGLALQLLGLGARLIADDRVELLADGPGRCLARAPEGLPLWIEARGIGLLGAPLAGTTQVVLAVDLDQTTPDRLPPHEKMLLAGAEVPVISGPVTAPFAVAVRLHCLHGRKD
jgi:HPr kinase/phosphorylase